MDEIAHYRVHISSAMGIVFIAMGLSYMLKKSTGLKHQESTKIGALAHFLKGFALALANPMLIFYWPGYLILFQTGIFSGGKPFFHFPDSALDPVKWSFSLGAAAGAGADPGGGGGGGASENNTTGGAGGDGKVIVKAFG